MKLSELLADYPDLDQEVGEDIARIAVMAKDYGRPGSVVVTLKVAKAKSRVAVAVSHKTKEPQPDAEAGLWHVGPNGLSKEDQFQGRLPIDEPTNRED